MTKLLDNQSFPRLHKEDKYAKKIVCNVYVRNGCTVHCYWLR